jgi:hypothetical protein
VSSASLPAVPLQAVRQGLGFRFKILTTESTDYHRLIFATKTRKHQRAPKYNATETEVFYLADLF